MTERDYDMTCDVCRGESGGKFVGVAAIPGAPVSVGWCNECLNNNAIPRHIVEFWLFYGAGEGLVPRDPPEEWPLADWVAQFTLWMGPERRYVKLPELLPELWRDEWERIEKEGA